MQETIDARLAPATSRACGQARGQLCLLAWHPVHATRYPAEDIANLRPEEQEHGDDNDGYQHQ
jgi:hypothetical protein